MTAVSRRYCLHCGGPSIFDYCSADCESHAGDERKDVIPDTFKTDAREAGGSPTCEVTTMHPGGGRIE